MRLCLPVSKIISGLIPTLAAGVLAGAAAADTREAEARLSEQLQARIEAHSSARLDREAELRSQAIASELLPAPVPAAPAASFRGASPRQSPRKPTARGQDRATHMHCAPTRAGLHCRVRARPTGAELVDEDGPRAR